MPHADSQLTAVIIGVLPDLKLSRVYRDLIEIKLSSICFLTEKAYLG